MQRILIVVALIILVLLLAHLISAWQFRQNAMTLVAKIETTGPVRMRQDLPEPVRAFNQRGLLGTDPAPGVIELTQVAEMELQPGQGWQGISARQVICTTSTGFVWQAWQSRGPLTMVRVIDAFTAGKGVLEVRLLGSIRVGHEAGVLADRSEAMRYLAELPWAPDAIALNRDVEWRVLESGEVEARLPMQPDDAVVRFSLDAQSDFAVMRANSRYAGMQDGAPVFKDWEGRFSDYAEIGGRRIPRRGEVGYVVDGKYQPYWRGHVIGLARE
ncbi:DUF6544 family protein [Alisedimentitalea sp. MJ-SS2]|uniref:DUF6544 family protein n=1 Tax=Aliisedimentitalea sp. MJ-SS2 TaxID=3049795 RepID=UPI00291135FD|nr:DUF6544 family protein [Alisedimentitalea sp. MJ-SS2]MDU8928245.1 DUF6544 family protein [Alisedimentitalea sp. MJ-SS2]